MEKLRLISKEILKNQRVAFLEEQFFSQAAQEKLWNQNDGRIRMIIFKYYTS